MAITKSAKKALRQSKRKKAVNDKRTRSMKDAVKRSRAATKEGSSDAAVTLAQAYQAIDKAVKRGVIKKNTGARRKSSLAKALGAKTK